MKDKLMVIVCKCNVHLSFRWYDVAFTDGNFLIECGKAIQKHCHIEFLNVESVHIQKCQCKKLGIKGDEATLIHILA